MKGWTALNCFAALLSLAFAKPIVDPGLFVIQGVSSCRDGEGYCMLGNNCTSDIDFLPDDSGGHCEGLIDAFTPKISFVCCRYNPLGKKTSVPPTTTLSPITITDTFSMIVEEAPNPDDYDELPEDFDPANVVDIVGVVTDFTGVIGLVTQPWTGTFPTRSSTTPTPPSSTTTTSTTSTTTSATTSTGATTVDQVTPQPEETTEGETIPLQETEQTSSATESYNELTTHMEEDITGEVTDMDNDKDKPNLTEIVFPPSEPLVSNKPGEVTDMDNDKDKPNGTENVFLPSQPLVSNKPVVELEEENQVDHTESISDELSHVEEDDEEEEDLLVAEAIHENENSGGAVNLEDNNIEMNTPPATTESHEDPSSTEASHVTVDGLYDNFLNTQEEEKRTTLKEERTDPTTETPMGTKMTMEGSMGLDHLQNTEEGNGDKDEGHSTTTITEAPVDHTESEEETNEVEPEEGITTITDGTTVVTDRTTVEVEDTTTIIGGTTHGNDGGPSIVGHGGNTGVETVTTGSFDIETTAPNKEPGHTVAETITNGQSGVVSPSQPENEETGPETDVEAVTVTEIEEGNIVNVENEAGDEAVSTIPDGVSVSDEENAPVAGIGTEIGETGIASSAVIETDLEEAGTEGALETETTKVEETENTTEKEMLLTIDEVIVSDGDKEPVTSSIGLIENIEGPEGSIHEDNTQVTEGSITEEIDQHTTDNEDVTDHDDVNNQHPQDSVGLEAIIFPQVGGTRPEEDALDQHVEETIAEEDIIDQELGGPIKENNIIDQQGDGLSGDADVLHQQVDNIIGSVGMIDQQVESVIDDENIIDQQVEEDNLIGHAPQSPVVEQQRPLQPVNQHVCGFKKYREPEEHNIVSRILGGSQATMIKWCWMAAIVEKNSLGDKYVCAGALIEPDLVMTTAACLSRIESRGLKAYRVVLGDSNLLMDLPYEVQFYDIAEVVSHPKFLTSGGAHANDIGLIRLNDDATLTDTVCLVCVAQQDADFAANSECYVTGYGQSHPHLSGYSDVHHPVVDHDEGILRELKVPLLEERKCRAALRNITGSRLLAQSNSFLCAGGLGEDGACYRTLDGGSPLTCHVHGRWYLVGLVSWSRDCTRPGVPNIYTRVSSFSNWAQANYLRMLGFVTHQIRLA